MIGLGAEVSDADRPAFLSYLTKNFGPDKGAKSGKVAATKAGDATQ